MRVPDQGLQTCVTCYDGNKLSVCAILQSVSPALPGSMKHGSCSHAAWYMLGTDAYLCQQMVLELDLVEGVVTNVQKLMLGTFMHCNHASAPQV